ncbi:nuclear pore complex protein Nup88 [Chelonus insularis]|uniref:nuclear pore complex protein Nup88 n=1 Tax=Chelonus insularis TaxID=460826 RepID=UPI00158F3724|nr:nuclear pore complex protein Nup88 [Chelonus insularis]
MTSCTDPLKLNDCKLFKELKNCLPKSEKETQNILEIRDDILYIWNAYKCCIHTLNLALIDENTDVSTISYQTLQPTDPPIFEITNLLINETATQLVLWGNLGIGIVELPRRWGRDNLFQGGKSSISCLNHILNGINAQLSSSFGVKRARWHPGSPNDSHLLVLTSDNSFQLYECSIGHVPKLMKHWKVGVTPVFSPTKKISTIESLGETAVDFDFVTPTIKNTSLNDTKDSHNWNEIEWPILVLRGDGNVLLVHGNILSNLCPKPVVFGSLSIFPAMFDNYGIDACSIMCLQTIPPVVVIATCTGKIYHAILLRENFINDDTQDAIDRYFDNYDNKKMVKERTWSEYGSNYSLHTPDDGLFVFEQLEMELGLLFDDEDKKYNCIINLHRDRSNKSRYFCSHNAGIHMITLPVLSQLQEYLNCSEDNIDLYLPETFHTSKSQYLLCTRTKHTTMDEATSIFGFGLFQQTWPILIALLHTGVVVDISVIDLDYLPQVETPEPMMNLHKNVTRESFETYIKNILKHESTSLPITKLSVESNLSGKECTELLDRATNIFRKHHFTKHDKIRSEIGRKVRALKALKNHQLKELDSLIQTKKELHDKAQHLAERYEDIKEIQEHLAKRARDLLRLVNHKELTSSERADAVELRDLNNKVDEFKMKFDRLKIKIENPSVKKELFKDSNKKENILNSKQEEAIKMNIAQMGKNIANMVTDIKTFEEEFGI